MYGRRDNETAAFIKDLSFRAEKNSWGSVVVEFRITGKTGLLIRHQMIWDLQVSPKPYTTDTSFPSRTWKHRAQSPNIRTHHTENFIYKKYMPKIWQKRKNMIASRNKSLHFNLTLHHRMEMLNVLGDGNGPVKLKTPPMALVRITINK